MVLKTINIDNFEDIYHFEASFDPQIVLLSDKKAKTVMRAIGKIFGCCDTTESKPPGRKEVISAVIEMNGQEYSVRNTDADHIPGMTENGPKDAAPDHYGAVRRSREETNISCFPASRTYPFHERLQRYKDTEKYYSAGEFTGITEGIGTTRTFRACLNSYIRQYEPEKMINSPEHRIVLRDDGLFTAELIGSLGRRAVLSSSEKTLFDFQCYLNVNAFWSEVERIRDMNHSPGPLLITALPGDLDASAGTPEWLEKAKSLGRQVILLDGKKREDPSVQ